MSDAIDTGMAKQRTLFAVCRQPLWHAGAASLTGAWSGQSMQVDDPGGGPGK